MRAGVADWIGVLFLVAIVYVLVRPQSKAAELVEGLGRMLVALVSTATGVNAPGTATGRTNRGYVP